MIKKLVIEVQKQKNHIENLTKLSKQISLKYNDNKKELEFVKEFENEFNFKKVKN